MTEVLSHNSLKSMEHIFPDLGSHTVTMTSDDHVEIDNAWNKIKESYESFYISVHTERSEETLHSNPLSYQFYENKFNSNTLQTHDQQRKNFIVGEQKFYNFYQQLFPAGVHCYSHFFQDSVQILNKQAHKRIILANLREMRSDTLLYPDLGIILCPTWSLFCLVFASRNYFKSDALQKAVCENGLHRINE